MGDIVQVPLTSTDSAEVLPPPPTTLLAEPPAFDAFYLANAARIGRALELTLQNPELAEDALNEAMTRALGRWKWVQTYANPSGWVYRTGLNWARSWLRRRRRERDKQLYARPVELVGAVEPGLAAALEALSFEHRSVVVCRFQLDLSTAETADALGIAEGTVKSRLSRALDQIRRDLGVTRQRAPASQASQASPARPASADGSNSSDSEPDHSEGV